MKITRIALKDYNQLKDLDVDLTYPKGHIKEGQPLDKVCFIGQGGTGKTSLLRVIKWFVSEDKRIGTHTELPVPNAAKMDLYFALGGMKSYITYSGKYLIYQTLSQGTFKDLRKDIKPLLINYPAEFLTESHQAKTEPDEKNGQNEINLEKLEPQHIIDFALEDVRKSWTFIIKDIKEHRAQELLLKNQIADTAAKNDATLEEIEKKTKSYKEWLANHPNPLHTLAKECLDPILNNLGLQTKTDFDLNTILNLGFIELKTLAGVPVPGDFWSTGTRQLVQTAVPLYQLKPKNAIILIDEPERSLYPDVQKNIIDTYVKLAPECQFFIATHSPIIASAFEPWEIVELKFDKEHQYVYQELHYTGENHVANYKYYPEYLRWDSILRRIFDLEEEGGQKRLQALEEMAELKIRTRKLKEKNQLDTPEGQKLMEQFKILSQKLDWQFD